MKPDAGHDLRSSLNAILIAAELMAADPLTDEQKQHLDRIVHAGRRLLRLIDELHPKGE